MESTKQFVIWLDGFISACGDSLNEEQTKKIKDKLDGIFVHEAGKDTNEQIAISIGISGLPSNYDLPQDPDGEVMYRC